jgi:hypothetical protein
MIEMNTCLHKNQWIDELIWNMNSTMSNMNEFMHSVISQSINSSVQWIHLVPNDLDEYIYMQESMIKWTHLLHEVNCTMNSFSQNFDEFIYLQSCIEWTHLIHEFNYEENQWMSLYKSWILEVGSDPYLKHFGFWVQPRPEPFGSGSDLRVTVPGPEPFGSPDLHVGPMPHLIIPNNFASTLCLS